MVDEHRTQLIEYIVGMRKAIAEIEKLEPGSIHHTVKTLGNLPREKLEEEIDNVLKECEDDDAKIAALGNVKKHFMLLQGFIEETKEALLEKVQPEGRARREREFKQFRKRRGTW